ncbi:uncharacterized protein GLRG_03207 [Colletotrichum graminicola M1.001]|uniref:Uncharacterized protein n=1 Tax=Colletotrichum graminicola (strain M1.001 / M2 / FGSC 10212) TaxID=645133 RepID=E3QB25_COLGM|nr:uncharacterized protein GLRG_03207 [Colletotrichum graminicola M1.001]EFQ28063.1 hypothetical protein GLRG_03207 [Colletotrichum graminicola M1.001]
MATPPGSTGEFGNSEWAAGYSNEDTPLEVGSGEGWSLLQKGMFLGVVVAAIAIYLKISKSRALRNSVGHEKTMA